MAKNLVIVESPAKAKTIGRFLGKEFKIEASVGHVRDLPKSQIGVDVEKDFEPKYITIRGKGDVISKLRKEAKAAKNIYLATDPDREGEAISWHLANILKIDENSKCRITFNEITQNAVKNAIKSPRTIDIDLVDAQQARRVLDRIVGYKISPLLWRKVKKGLSAGRVQSVATRLVCDREGEIEKFVPEEYWSIVAELKKLKSRLTFEAKFYGNENEKIELKDKEQVDKILKELEAEKFIVKSVKKGERSKAPAPPFITSTLQQEASRRLGFPTRKTMLIAQQLYEGIEVKGVGALGLVTYIRTDSTRISSEAQKEAESLVKSRFGENYLPKSQRIYKNKSSSQDAHEAIRPTKVNMTPESIKGSLSNDQFKLYKLIWGRFIASQMASAVYDTISIDIKSGKYIFKASGSAVKFKGYMEAYTESKDDDNDNDNDIVTNIPDLSENELLDCKQMNPKQHFTQPPQRYTEATLVRALEEKGIGRPSTYAPTITTILARGYVIRDKRYLMPTELGRVVTDIMKNHFKDIVDVRFTAQMEKELDEIEEGSKKWVQVVKEFYEPFQDVLKLADSQIEQVEIPDEVTDVICEKCGKNMVIKNGRYGKFLACPGFPECRNTKPHFLEAGVNCPKCGAKVLVKKTKKNRTYYGCENNPKCSFMIWDKPINENCPECQSFLIKAFSAGKTQVKCSNESCDFVKEGEKKAAGKK